MILKDTMLHLQYHTDDFPGQCDDLQRHCDNCQGHTDNLPGHFLFWGNVSHRLFVANNVRWKFRWGVSGSPISRRSVLSVMFYPWHKLAFLLKCVQNNFAALKFSFLNVFIITFFSSLLHGPKLRAIFYQQLIRFTELIM